MYKLFRPFLFLLPTEMTHYLMLSLLKITYKLGLMRLFFSREDKQSITIFGLAFKNPIGIAAGLDKNGDYINCLAGLGAGFIEVGAITPIAQAGNRKPRLHRLVKDNALINAMGFNNKGVDYLVRNLKKRKTDCIVGVNLGKNKQTPLADAAKDYNICLQKVYLYADFVTVNISSPNTPGLQELQTEIYLKNLLLDIKQMRDQLAEQYHKKMPLLVKIAPDLADAELFTIIDTIKVVNLDGIIATNTTRKRGNLRDNKKAKLAGGVSGAPLTQQSDLILQKIKQYASELPVISVGGITSVVEAKKRFEHGADLIQLYTGLIFEGPGLIKDLLNDERCRH